MVYGNIAAIQDFYVFYVQNSEGNLNLKVFGFSLNIE